MVANMHHQPDSPAARMVAAFQRFVRQDVHTAASIYWAARSALIHAALVAQPGDRVLDLGCNTGLLSRAIECRGADVTGADLDMAAVHTAARHADHQRLRSRYLAASAEQLPFADNSFDAITCIDVLDIVPDDAGALREMLRVLQPGGRLVLTVISRDRRNLLTSIAFAEHIRNYDRAGLRDLLLAAGFTLASDSSFYRYLGGLARELGALAHRAQLGRIPGLGFGISLTLAMLTRADRWVPSRRHDGGMIFLATKPADLGELDLAGVPVHDQRRGAR